MNKIILLIVLICGLFIGFASYYFYNEVNSIIKPQSVYSQGNYEWCAVNSLGEAQCYYSSDEECLNFIKTHDGLYFYCRVNQ
jgi:hypothetical protein